MKNVSMDILFQKENHFIWNWYFLKGMISFLNTLILHIGQHFIITKEGFLLHWNIKTHPLITWLCTQCQLIPRNEHWRIIYLSRNKKLLVLVTRNQLAINLFQNSLFSYFLNTWHIVHNTDIPTPPQMIKQKTPIF